MNKEEITEKIREFHEYLDISNSLSDAMRYVAWAFLRGVAWITDSLENITDKILMLKVFYQDENISSFVETIKPFLYVLLAFSILYAGYMLMFNKKFNREGMIINIFLAFCVIILLSTVMDKVDDFTDDAIDVIRTEGLFEGEEGAKLSDSIINQGVTDLAVFDKDGWQNKDLEVRNEIPTDSIRFINPKEIFTESGTDLKLSSLSKSIAKSRLTTSNGGFTVVGFDQSGLEYNNEYYFRYSIDWFHILMTLSIIAFTLLSISIKMARLFFDLAFNYLLAIIIAPVDVHDGQKTKKVLQSIFNIFIVTIMMFLSMKVYIIGTEYLSDNMSGIAYLVALIAFSLAVIDAPNIVERLFGIDAGMKSGWGMFTAAYLGGRVIAGGVDTANSMRDKGVNTMRGLSSKSRGEKDGNSSINDSRDTSTNGSEPARNGKQSKDSESVSMKDKGSAKGSNSINKKDNQSGDIKNNASKTSPRPTSEQGKSNGGTVNSGRNYSSTSSGDMPKDSGSLGSDINNKPRVDTPSYRKMNTNRAYKTTTSHNQDKKNLRNKNRKGSDES